MPPLHTTVLLKEAIDTLALEASDVVVDATLGAGGHARSIISKLNSDGTFIGIDQDASAIEALHDHELPDTKATLIFEHTNFVQLDTILTQHKIAAVDAILADLGWRTDQFELSGKGFSFVNDEPLLMTYGDPTTYAFTAHDIVNDWAESDIANVIYAYGEERASRRIAKAIVEARKQSEISSAAQLADIVSSVVRKTGRIHPATKTFQALRIAVNDELDRLETFITKSFAALRPTGRLAIITFHSLEDRIVKHRFRELAHDHKGTLITKKPITASEDELLKNPRARSAKLRVIEKN